MATEDIDIRFADLDAWPMASALNAMWEGQMAAVAAVREALPALAAAIAAAVAALGETGRLVYVGAGTSGRVAVQDGAELPPTFSWPLERIVFAMAGGDAALLRSIEGAEDDAPAGVARMDLALVGPSDVVIGLAASGATPFTVAALQRATERGAVSIGLANNRNAPLFAVVRHSILLETGCELIAGSTRMKAGTAQKIALNLLSTCIMLRLGRVHRGMMVNMHIGNAKLRRRGEAMVARLADCTPETASHALDRADGEIKLAVLLAIGIAPDVARAALAAEAGNLRQVLSHIQSGAAP